MNNFDLLMCDFTNTYISGIFIICSIKNMLDFLGNFIILFFYILLSVEKSCILMHNYNVFLFEFY